MDQPLVQILVGVAKIEQSLVEHAMFDTGAGKDFVPTALVHELFGIWAQRQFVLLGKWRCSGRIPLGVCVLDTIEMGQQRTWDHIPKRNCTGEHYHNLKLVSLLIFWLWKCISLARWQINPPTVSSLFTIIYTSNFVRARASLLLALFGDGALDWKMQLTFILSLLWVMRIKAKTWGVLGYKKAFHDVFLKYTKIPFADRTHHRIRSPSIKCSGT